MKNRVRSDFSTFDCALVPPGTALPAIDTGREPGISSGPGPRFYQLERRLSWPAWGWRWRLPSLLTLPRW
jgi:hypothetical protein